MGEGGFVEKMTLVQRRFMHAYAACTHEGWMEGWEAGSLSTVLRWTRFYYGMVPRWKWFQDRISSIMERFQDGSGSKSGSKMEAVPSWKRFHLGIGSIIESIPSWNRFHLGIGSILEPIPSWNRFYY